MWAYNKWFILVCILVMFLVTYVPGIALWLPERFYVD